MTVLDEDRVKLELFPSDGIYEGVDLLVEGVEKEEDVDGECPSETFGVGMFRTLSKVLYIVNKST